MFSIRCCCFRSARINLHCNVFPSADPFDVAELPFDVAAPEAPELVNDQGSAGMSQLEFIRKRSNYTFPVANARNIVGCERVLCVEPACKDFWMRLPYHAAYYQVINKCIAALNQDPGLQQVAMEMFHHKLRIRPAWYLNSPTLQGSVQRCGLAAAS